MKTSATSKTATAKKTTSPSKKSPAQKVSLNTTADAKSGAGKSPGQNALPTDQKRAATSSHAHADEIAARAYKIWQQQGCPEGCDEQHWRQAEQEILREGSGVLVP
ncbi:DUF2934 domain-containing protein [Prosthecobacter sp.]|uniref:DUF2934 domain-containing protein n=1 Tax=Prosthecobacter sp. TaxID=1965333 RepID=UPI00378524EF